jgi:hypothetical protein
MGIHKSDRKLISIGIAPHDGFISIGVSPHGLISIGAIPHGLISIGLVPMGVVSFGLVSMGLVSVGAISMGLVSAGRTSMSFVQLHAGSHEQPAGTETPHNTDMPDMNMHHTMPDQAQ